ncbi:unnamed protein product [Candidula unifasciata]|uniref:Methyltransferase-like 26 n=1 Tax=Candidula unifasciata TaxID=100452 RepID=A0A8S3ZVJ6_9EUPU|nr:unnamed protein product [Candidula unifasciata]
MLVASAAERNKQPILEVLQHYIPPAGGTRQILEIASGTGQHIAHFAPHFPHVTWQPSDIDPVYIKSISAFITGKHLKNVLQPMVIDITKPIQKWANQNMKPESYDLILNSNMVHISPWETSLGLFKTAGYLLKPHGVLFMYGPFRIDGVLTPESNVHFDASLRSQNPTWGVRDICDLKQLAKQNDLVYEKMVDMPANNKCVIFRKI